MNIDNNKKIRIKLRAYSQQLLKLSCVSILNATTSTNTQTVGPIAIPTKRKIYCVLRSPHVDKDSREHFEIKIYTRIIDLCKPSMQTIDALMKLNIPAGVDVEVKL